MLYAKMFGYFAYQLCFVSLDNEARLTPRKASMVVVYSLSKFVVQAGTARLMDPLRGRDISSLFISVILLVPVTRIDNLHDIDTGGVEGLHALVVVQTSVDRVHTDGIDAELLEIRDISRAIGRIGQWVDE